MNARLTLLKESVAAFESKFNCRLCLHDYTGQLSAEAMPFYHRNPFCTKLKSRKKNLTAVCVNFDRHTVPQFAMTHANRPFFKICHCGMTEGVFPILLEKRLCGAVFAGPFQPLEKQEQDDSILRAPLTFPADAPGNNLPVFPEKERSFFLAFGSLIASYTALCIEKPVLFSGSRKELIEAFLQANYASPAGLNELAETLHLTPARASEAVKKHFGKGFSRLLQEKRLEEAGILLTNSSFTIEILSKRCGFHDPAYFHRVFRRFYGMTPDEFRHKNAVTEA